MVELVKRWAEQVNQKSALRTMVKDVHFSFQLWDGEENITIKIENDLIHITKTAQPQSQSKQLEGNEELFQSIILGERKLREVVKNNEIKTTFSFRELLLMEALFYLGKPKEISEFSTKLR